MRCLGKLVLSVGAFLLTTVSVGFMIGWTMGEFGFDIYHPSEGEFVLSFLLFPVLPLAIGYSWIS